MKTVSIRKIRKSLEKIQDNKRFAHTIAVTYTATALAMRYRASIKNAELAGMLHDCAKCMSDEKRLLICEKHNIPGGFATSFVLSITGIKSSARKRGSRPPVPEY